MRKTQEQFVAQAMVVHSTKYDYSKVDYINTITKVIIVCPFHGDFNQTPKAHQHGQGCPMCANQKRAQVSESSGEQKIEQFMVAHTIKYEKQKMFEECKHVYQLRYDFFLPDHNMLIEFDGQQHFVFTEKFHKTKERFKIFQLRDKIKEEYALNNGYKLIHILYNQEHNINTILSQLIIEVYSPPPPPSPPEPLVSPGGDELYAP